MWFRPMGGPDSEALSPSVMECLFIDKFPNFDDVLGVFRPLKREGAAEGFAAHQRRGCVDNHWQQCQPIHPLQQAGSVVALVYELPKKGASLKASSVRRNYPR